MQLATIDGEADLAIHNVSILPSDQCATEEQRVSAGGAHCFWGRLVEALKEFWR